MNKNKKTSEKGKWVNLNHPNLIQESKKTYSRKAKHKKKDE